MVTIFLQFFCLWILGCREACIKSWLKYTPKVTIYAYIMLLIASQHGEWNMLCDMFLTLGVNYTPC